MSKEKTKAFEDIKEIVDRIQQKDEDAPLELDLLWSFGSHRENAHSSVIAYLINPKKGYLDKFLNSIGVKDISTKDATVVTEKNANGRRIDIFIETSDSIIIIENKIYAQDQNNQLIDYYNFVKEVYNNKTIYVFYLTLDGKKPSDISIGSEWVCEKNELAKPCNDDVYVNLISYKKHILKWLECVNEELDYDDLNENLKTAIYQYKVSIETLTSYKLEKIHEIILSVSEDKKELLSLLNNWYSLGEFQYRYLYKGLIRILYLHKYLNESLKGEWKFASWNVDEQKYEKITDPKYLRNLPHMYLYNIKKGIVLMIFKDYSEQIQLHYINENLEDCGHPEPKKEWQKYFKDWGVGYTTRHINEIDDIKTWIDEAEQSRNQKNSSS